MTTPENTLQPSEKLAPFVAPYRDEAPLVSTSEINAMLANRDRLPTRSSHTIRKAIMTLAGLTAIASLVYVTLFGTSERQVANKIGANSVQTKPPTPSFNDRSRGEESKRIAHSVSERPLPARPLEGDREFVGSRDQVYAELNPAQLASLGIILNSDTVITYTVDANGQLTSTKLTPHFISGGEPEATLPSGVEPARILPVLMTMGDGRAAAFHYEKDGVKEWGLAEPPQDMSPLLLWLRLPGTPGYHLLGFRSSSSITNHGREVDTIRIEIVRDLPLPSPIPVNVPNVESLSDEQKQGILKLAHYHEGLGAKPSIQLPDNLTIVVDTLTVPDLRDEIDRELHNPTMQRIRSIAAHLNELVPVVVHKQPGDTKRDSNDYIFWYEPSEQLFAALRPAVGTLFQKPLSHTYCLTAPNSISQDAEITYCVPEAQQVEAIVQDLVGHIFRIVLADAHAGDNTLSIPTEVLPSGMYIVTLRMKDGSQQSRRIWSQNDSPTPLPTSVRIDMPAHTNDHRAIYTFPQNYRASTFAQDIQAQRGNEFENLDIDSFLSRQPNIPSDVRKELQKSMKSAQGQLRAANNTVARNSDALKNERAMAIEYLSLDSSVAVQSLGVENQDVLVAYYRTTSDLSNRVMFGVVREWGLITTQVAASSITHPTPSLYPTIVTDALGRKRMIETTSDTVINELVPVLFRRPGTQDSLGGRDIVFWYEPTTEFLAALPDSSRQSVRAMMGTRSVPNAQLRTALPGIRTYPNPSHGAFALDLTLDAPRKVSAIVRNLLGQERARRVIDAPQGTSTEHFSFDALEDGIYLLELTTDAGETQFQRIVIEH